MTESDYKKILEDSGEITDSIIVCPLCFYEEHDCWEFPLRDGKEIKIQCAECNGEYLASMCIDVEYTSRKLCDDP